MQSLPLTFLFFPPGIAFVHLLTGAKSGADFTHGPITHLVACPPCNRDTDVSKAQLLSVPEKLDSDNLTMPKVPCLIRAIASSIARRGRASV